MTGLIGRIVLAVIIAVIVTLLCILLGTILVTLKIDIAVKVGDFFQTYGAVIGVLAGLWYFFTHGGVSPA